VNVNPYHKIIRLLASGFGLGYAPVAPGTFGTLLGSLFFFTLRYQFPHPVPWFVRFSLVVAVVSIAIAHLAEKSYGRKDCQHIVIDEVAGVLFCYAFLPYSTFNLVMGFILFRLFDVAKIFPAKWSQDNLPGGLGVVADDLVAGAQGGIILYYLPQILQKVGDAVAWVHKFMS
jgi:phosphatidylglycerophosphatase A